MITCSSPENILVSDPPRIPPTVPRRHHRDESTALLTTTSGHSIYAGSELTSLTEMTRVLAEFSGKKIDTLHLTEDQFLGSGKAELVKKITPEMWKQYLMFWHK